MEEKKQRKKLKDTKLGQFLKGKLPKVLDVAGDLLPDKGLLGVIKNIIDKERPSLTTQDYQQIQELYENELKELQLHVENTKDARDMQKVALQQEDIFSKRFVYYFASILFTTTLSLICLLCFIDVPDKNRDLIYMAVGTLMGTGISSIVQFFYGSSISSKQKTEEILKMKGN